MTNSIRLAPLFLVGALLADTAASAAPNTCIPNAYGVPSRYGAPKWGEYQQNPNTNVIDATPDDPRWQGSSGNTFSYGSAKDPLEMRAVWANEGGQEYLYLSFKTNLSPNTTMQRDLWVGFRRKTPLDPPGDPKTEHAYILQFHLAGAALANPTFIPTFCGDSCSNTTSYWRAWVDRGNVNADSCDASASGTFPEYDPFNGASSTTPPFDWINTLVDASGNRDPEVMYFNTHDQWAVHLRLKVAATGDKDINHGVEKGSKIWYELTANLPGTGGQFTAVAQWPRTLAKTICPNFGLDQYLIEQDHKVLANWADASLVGGGQPAPATACDGGLALAQMDVGEVTDTPVATITGETAMNYGFVGGGHTNSIVARIKNTTAAQIDNVRLEAHFRLANWGAAGWTAPGESGKWVEIRGSEGGICAAPPAAGDTTHHCGTTSIPADDASGMTHPRKVIGFTWQLGASGNPMGPSEYCRFGLKPPVAGGDCAPCQCTSTDKSLCDAVDPAAGPFTGTIATGGLPGAVCVTKRNPHQCMLVELAAGDSAVDFVNQSVWNNMTFGGMSVFSQEAVVDVRGLPKTPDQRWQDVYLLVMPRNMPKTLPPNTTGASLVARNLLGVARDIARPYAEDIKKMSEGEIAELDKKLHHGMGGGGYGNGGDDLHKKFDFEGAQQLERARLIMPGDDYRHVGEAVRLIDAAGQVPAESLTHDVVNSLGPSLAADVVPTLDIYAFYRMPGSSKKHPAYLPMTSFSVFLHHDGPVSSIDYVIDGAQKVGENVYHVEVPVERARRIQIRSQALAAGEVTMPPGSATWPCGCACGGNKCSAYAGISNTVPAFVAGVLVIGRRRRRKKQ